MITNKDYKVDVAKSPDKNFMFDFAKEMYSDKKASGNKNTSDKNSHKITSITSYHGFGTSTKLLADNPIDLCDGLDLLLQQKQVGKNSDPFKEKLLQ